MPLSDLWPELWEIKLRPGEEYKPADRLGRRTVTAACVCASSILVMATIIQLVFVLKPDIFVADFEAPSALGATSKIVLGLLFYIASMLFSITSCIVMLAFASWLTRITRNILIMTSQDNQRLTLWYYQVVCYPFANNFFAGTYFRELSRQLFPQGIGAEQIAEEWRFFEIRSRALVVASLAPLLLPFVFFGYDWSKEDLVPLFSGVMWFCVIVALVMVYCWNTMILRSNRLQQEKYNEYLNQARLSCPACGEPVSIEHNHCPLCGDSLSILWDQKYN